jgi:hypothetical protein
MTYFLGQHGKIKLSRKAAETFSSSVLPADINTTLNRFGFDNSLENLITGDQLGISTTDPRGLDFLPSSTWPDGGGATLNQVVAYANVNAIGGIRLFQTFTDAINNNRAAEYPLEAFTGTAILIDVQIYGSVERVLGDVTGYNFNTDREALDTTTMSDRFKRMYSAGLISGAGSIDCLFSVSNSGLTENSLLMLQLINRINIGSEFKCYLQITDSDAYTTTPDIYYEFAAVITRTGIEVRTDQVISCAIDFATTGEIKLLIGEPSGYILKEDTDRLRLQQNLDFLLTEVTD